MYTTLFSCSVTFAWFVLLSACVFVALLNSFSSRRFWNRHQTLKGEVGLFCKAKDPFHIFDILGRWYQHTCFYRQINIKWVMWSISLRLSSLSQDIFPATQCMLGCHMSQKVLCAKGGGGYYEKVMNELLIKRLNTQSKCQWGKTDFVSMVLPNIKIKKTVRNRDRG